MKIIKAIKRLWQIGTCTHKMSIETIQFADTVRIEVCVRCGRVIGGITNEEMSIQNRIKNRQRTA